MGYAYNAKDARVSIAYPKTGEIVTYSPKISAGGRRRARS